MRRLSGRALLLCLCACHPLSLYAPDELPEKVETGTGGKVEILLDDRGIPHIYADNLNDVSFGLGFMHGRDRLFQIIVLRHASQGRLTEVFGKDLLDVDRRLRLIAWHLDEHVAALDEPDRRMLEAYTHGLNAGARNAGQSAEMAVLRLDVPVFAPKDALSIMRLQAWQLGVDHVDEVVRHRLLQLLAENDPRREFIDAPVSSGNVSITGLGDGPDGVSSSLSLRGGPAASNSWAVDGAHTTSGHAILSNDPHLDHSAPGVFYLAHLETPSFTVAGATLPGGPVVVIGFGRKVAWGMTSSFADAQDVLRVKVPAGRDDVYELDGELVPFEKTPQTFVTKSGEKLLEETWRTTRMGPVFPDGYPGMTPEDPLALTWGAFVPEHNRNVLSGFIALAAATNHDEADAAVEKIRGSGQNVLLAFGDGSVAYRLAAFTPKRPPNETGRVPRDGSKSANFSGAFLDASERPKVDAPGSGFLVAANQRVIGDADPRTSAVGTIGVSHSRAARIRQRIEALLARPERKATGDELLAIQGDVQSVEAKLYVNAVGKLCPKEEQVFCDAVRKFDGNFSKDSFSALPYTLLLDAIGEEVVRSLGDIPEKLVGPVASTLVMRNAAGRALVWPKPQTLIDAKLVARAATKAHQRLVELTGPRPAQWRYGKLHTLQLKGPLAQAPIVGSFFSAEPYEESGDGSTVRAEDGLPVKHGSCLRMLVEMSDPPVARLTIDTGQSGHPATAHWMDQHDDWAKVSPRKLPIARSEVEAAARARIELLP